MVGFRELDDGFVEDAALGVIDPSPEPEPLVRTVTGSTTVERRRANPLNNPLEKLLVGFGFSVLVMATVETLEELETGVDIPEELTPPRIVFTSWAEASTACTLELALRDASLGVAAPVPTRADAGLGIIEPTAREAIGTETLDDRVVEDRYIGGKMVGAGFALGGSIADSVYSRIHPIFTHTQ